MLCVDFESLLTDYIEGVTGPETNRQMAEHAMKCPVCHETLIGSQKHCCSLPNGQCA